MAGVLVRKVLQPAQSKDHEQRRGVTPCKEAQRIAIFLQCSL